MYIHTLARFCESQRRFFSPLSLKYYILFFFCLLSLFPPCCRVSSSFPSSTAPQARGHPRPSLLLPAFPPLVLRCLSCLLCVRPGCLAVCPLSTSPFIPIGRALEAPRRPSVCPVVCLLVSAVTRQPSGVRQCGSVGRCTAYMSPAFCPLAYVLPCLVPCLVPWLPAVRPCVCAAAVCPLVVVTACTPLYPGRRLFGAASVM